MTDARNERSRRAIVRLGRAVRRRHPGGSGPPRTALIREHGGVLDPRERMADGEGTSCNHDSTSKGDTRHGDRDAEAQGRPGGDAQGRRHHGRDERRAGQDRRGRRRRGRDGARARAVGHPQGRRRGAHVAREEDQGDPEDGLHPGHGQVPHRPLRRGADPRVAGRRLHRRVRGADARRRALPRGQARLQGALRLRLPRSGRGAPAHRRRARP